MPDEPGTLLFAVVEPVGPDVVSKMTTFAEGVRKGHDWTREPPTYVYAEDTESCTKEGDEPTVTCGVRLHLAATDGPPLAATEPTIPRGLLGDTEYLVEQVRALSSKEGFVVEVEYNRVHPRQTTAGCRFVRTRRRPCPVRR